MNCGWDASPQEPVTLMPAMDAFWHVPAASRSPPVASRDTWTPAMRVAVKLGLTTPDRVTSSRSEGPEVGSSGSTPVNHAPLTVVAKSEGLNDSRDSTAARVLTSGRLVGRVK